MKLIPGAFSQAQMKAKLQYDPVTGEWRRVVAAGRQRAGDRPGTISADGYRRIKIGNRDFLEHVLAWFYMTGEWPTTDIDHKDNVKSNNVWSNLRLATRAQNVVNAPVRKNSSTGYRGVSFKKETGRFVARIRVKTKLLHLGYFASAEAAAEIYQRACAKHYGEFARQQ